jgi:hypothetical protein
MIITILGIVITMIPESLLRSFRNAHHDHFGIAITLPRNPHGNSLYATHSLCRLAEDGPIQTESSPVPAGHRVRSDQMEALFPVGPESAKGNPKQLVEQTNPWFRMPAFQDNKLLAKSEVLQHQVLARAKKAKDDS